MHDFIESAIIVGQLGYAHWMCSLDLVNLWYTKFGQMLSDIELDHWAIVLAVYYEIQMDHRCRGDDGIKAVEFNGGTPCHRSSSSMKLEK